ncbi:MAG: Uma2 family endonuclease [Acidobacteria bacterium]|nr:Uma2 family endonuclease [Acidobacteriota bacterium]MBI3425113.1 Uma2 family endonuclease [Acidobacteriota bacterium]
MTPQRMLQPLISEEEYLALEREAEERHEYLDGVIYKLAGESPEHGRICINLTGQLYNQLLDTPCEAFSKDTKVRSGPVPKPHASLKGFYSYPDLLVACGELKHHDNFRDVLLNPTVIIEVLSPATEAFDRGEKWERYQLWLPSLTDYVLVSQAKPLLEHFERQTDGAWLYRRTAGLEASLQLNSIACTLRLTDVYNRVVFPPEPEDPSEELPDTELPDTL